MFLKLTGFGVPPTATQAIEPACDGAVDVGPTVADHQGAVTGIRIESDAVEAVSDDLILVDARIVCAGAVDAVDHGIEMEMLAHWLGLILRLARGDCQVQAVGAQLYSRPGILWPGLFGSSNTALSA